MRAIAGRIAIVLLALAAVAVGSGAGAGDGDEAREGARDAVVTRVVDGDTVVLSGVGRSRLIGVDTPVLWSQRVISPKAAPIHVDDGAHDVAH